MHSRLNIFCGHFGSGKSEVSINYAIKLAKEDKKVTIMYKGRKIAKKKLKRTIANMHRSLNERNDRSYAFPCTIEVSIR